MCSEGRRSEFGGPGGTHGHILYPAKVDRIATVFDQNFAKNGQKGVPPVFTGFLGSLRALWTPAPRVGPRGRFCPGEGGPSPQDKNRTLGLNIEVGGGPKCPLGSQNRVLGRGGATLSPL